LFRAAESRAHYPDGLFFEPSGSRYNEEYLLGQLLSEPRNVLGCEHSSNDESRSHAEALHEDLRNVTNVKDSKVILRIVLVERHRVGDLLLVLLAQMKGSSQGILRTFGFHDTLHAAVTESCPLTSSAHHASLLVTTVADY